jgi:hypothetical protein
MKNETSNDENETFWLVFFGHSRFLVVMLEMFFR